MKAKNPNGRAVTRLAQEDWTGIPPSLRQLIAAAIVSWRAWSRP
jgi:hypothetical protein